jgi:hypothetical protein
LLIATEETIDKQTIAKDPQRSATIAKNPRPRGRDPKRSIAMVKNSERPATKLCRSLSIVEHA